MAKAVRNNNSNNNVIPRKFDLNLRKKLVKWQIWIIAIGAVETLTHRKVFVKIFLSNVQFTLNDYKILKQSVQIPKYFVCSHLES
jgi:hypothetical protein